jgi:hypothetical protein
MPHASAKAWIAGGAAPAAELERAYVQASRSNPAGAGGLERTNDGVVLRSKTWPEGDIRGFVFVSRYENIEQRGKGSLAYVLI